MRAVEWINSSSFKCQLGRKLQTKNRERESKLKLTICPLLTQEAAVVTFNCVSFTLIHSFTHSLFISFSYFLVIPRNFNKLYKLKIIQTNMNPEWVFFVVRRRRRRRRRPYHYAIEYNVTRGEFFN